MPQDQPAWRFEHSIDCGVSAEFAWGFWTKVSNWALDADVVSVEIDGPFAAGAHGITNSKSSGRIEWRITEVQPGSAVIEFPPVSRSGPVCLDVSSGGKRRHDYAALQARRPAGRLLREGDGSEFRGRDPGGNAQTI